MTHSRAFSPGFRFSMMDGLVLVSGAIGTTILYGHDEAIGISTAMAVVHFFLFCNIFRLSRPPELIWTAFFVIAAALATLSLVHWWVAWTASILMASLLIIMEMRRPYYHGVGWRSVNPCLPQWWEMNTQRIIDSDE